MIKKKILLAGLLTLLSGCALAPYKTSTDLIDITLLGLNDLHGNIQAEQPTPGILVSSDENQIKRNIPAGGAAYLASLIQQRRAMHPDSLIVGAGDLIGASPVTSALLHDEPTIEVLNQIGLSVSSLGNHELDAGKKELERKMQGACPAKGCAFSLFSGTRYDIIAANVIDENTGKSWLKPYVIRTIAGIKMAFIGAVTQETAHLVSPSGIRGLKFIDEATAINTYVDEVRQQGARIIVVLIHEGGESEKTLNDLDYQCPGFKGPIVDIAKRLDHSISVIMSGHTHQAYLCKRYGKLIVQGGQYGTLLTEVNLKVDPVTQHVVDMQGINHVVDQERLTKNKEIGHIVAEAQRAVAPFRDEKVAKLSQQLRHIRNRTEAESVLGNIVADAQREYTDADIAFMNPGGIRQHLPATTPSPGPVSITRGDIFAAQPFGNMLVTMILTGQQIKSVLEEQWLNSFGHERILHISHGFSYRWAKNAISGSKILTMTLHGQPVESDKTYRVVVNSFLAAGGDGFKMFLEGKNPIIKGKDLDALEAYIKKHELSLTNSAEQRIFGI